MSSHACVFVNPSCNDLQKNKASSPIEPRIAMSSHACVFVNPLKPVTHCIILTHLASILQKNKSSISFDSDASPCTIVEVFESGSGHGECDAPADTNARFVHELLTQRSCIDILKLSTFWLNVRLFCSPRRRRRSGAICVVTGA